MPVIEVSLPYFPNSAEKGIPQEEQSQECKETGQQRYLVTERRVTWLHEQALA